MKTTNNRRQVLQQLAVLPLALGSASTIVTAGPDSAVRRRNRKNLKISLNAYSFNKSLSEGSMGLDELLEFSSETGFDAVDLTAYYFPGYPGVPSDAYLYEVKRKAFRLGLALSGTGVRNDFTHADARERSKSIQLVKDWVIAAQKLGAPVLRVFAGHQPHSDRSWEEVAAWMVEDLKTCVAFGKQHGVMIAIQNHNSFLKTAAQVNHILEAVADEWFGLILDIGSYRQGDPFREIQDTIDHAVSWQLKEEMYVNGEAVKTDVDRLIQIIKSSDYKGYIPIETLGPGDPWEKVKALFRRVKQALG